MVQIINFNEEDFFSRIRQMVREEVEKVNNDAKEKPLSIKEAAAFLNCGVQTLYNQTSQGKVPHHKKGHAVLFFKDELLAWVKSGKKLTQEDYMQRAIETLTK